MTLSNQGEILRVAVADTTSAVINTLKTTTVLAAAPANFRYRICGVSIAFDLGTATPAAASGILAQIGPVAGPYLSIIWQNQTSDHDAFGSGIPLSSAGAINLRTWPSVAVALAFVVSVRYVQEPV